MKTSILFHYILIGVNKMKLLSAVEAKRKSMDNLEKVHSKEDNERINFIRSIELSRLQSEIMAACNLCKSSIIFTCLDTSTSTAEFLADYLDVYGYRV